MPRLSVGMPVYNSERTVEAAVRSVLRQSFSDLEIVLSDNASSDRTGDICRALAAEDSRIRYVRQATNIGMHPNMLFVFRESRAPYFMWAAGDDERDPTFAERCVRELDRDAEIGVAMTEWTMHGRWTGNRFAVRSFPDFGALANADRRARLRFYIPLSSTRTHKGNFIYGVWRRELLADVLARFEHMTPKEIYSGADVAMLTYALAHRPFRQVPGALFRKYNPGFAIGSAPHAARLLLGRVRHPLRTLNERSLFQPDVDRHVGLLEYALREAGALDAEFSALLDWKRSQPVGS